MDGDLPHALMQPVQPETPSASPAGPAAAVADALRRRNIAMRGFRSIGAVETALMPLARRLGDDYGELRVLLERAKASASGSHPSQTLNLDAKPGSAIGKIVQVAHELEKFGMLSRQHYRKSPSKLLQIRANTEPHARRFLTGTWLEFYAFDAARRMLRALGRSPDSVFSGVAVIVPPGDEFDLDACILLPDGDLVWIETKTGRKYNDLLAKYGRIARLLGLDANRAILLCPEIGVADAGAVVTGAMAGMTITGLDRFPEVLAQALGRD